MHDPFGPSVHGIFLSVLCSARTVRVLGSASPFLRRSLPFLHRTSSPCGLASHGGDLCPDIMSMIRSLALKHSQFCQGIPTSHSFFPAVPSSPLSHHPLMFLGPVIPLIRSPSQSAIQSPFASLPLPIVSHPFHALHLNPLLPALPPRWGLTPRRWPSPFAFSLCSSASTSFS